MPTVIVTAVGPPVPVVNLRCVAETERVAFLWDAPEWSSGRTYAYDYQLTLPGGRSEVSSDAETLTCTVAEWLHTAAPTAGPRDLDRSEAQPEHKATPSNSRNPPSRRQQSHAEARDLQPSN